MRHTTIKEWELDLMLARADVRASLYLAIWTIALAMGGN